MRVIRSKRTPVFRTRREIERYFGGDTIECLICGRHFKRLHTHLAAKHGMAVDEYKRRFGLSWTRGLTSATSLANSGWTDERKTKAREVAEKSQFFKFAHLTARRELAPFLKTEAIEHLGVNAKAFGKKFDERVRALAAKGLSFRAIARVLNVAHSTVLERTTRRRKGKPRAAG
jgi:ROS/MUCR transcriptional regulator protein/Helix-turn-helix domain